jgi:hypothetical protein
MRKQRVVRGPQRARGAVAVAGGDGQRCALGHGQAGVADHLGERAQAHDLRAQAPGHRGRVEQAAVGELGAVGHDLARRAADGDQPALGLHAGGRLDAGDLRIHEGRRVGHDLFQRVHEHRRRDVRQQLDRLDLLEILLRQRMDHEGEAVHALEAVGIDDARLQAQAGDDFQVVVFQDLLRELAGGRDDHRVEQAGAQHVTEQHGRGVDHHVHALVLELGDALVVDGGGDDGLAGQFLQPELVELMRRGHEHRGLLHRLAQHEAGPFLDRAGGQVDRQRPVLHIVRAGAVELQRLDRGQELGHAELQQRVGEHHVVGVLGHRHRQLVVRHARQEHHACVVEVVAELDLGVAHRPFLQDVAEPPADGGQRLFGHRLQLGAVFLDEAVRARTVAVLQHTQADGVGFAVPLADQGHRAGRAAVRAQALDMKLFTEEGGREREVLGGRAQADADN